MSEFKCESCGSTEFIKQNGVYTCQYCGTKFSPSLVDEINLNKRDVTELDINNAEVEVLLKKAKSFVETGSFSNAKETIAKILELDDENAQAYLYKLMTEFRVTKLSEFADKAIDFESSNNYKMVMKYGDEELRESLSAYAMTMKKKIMKSEQSASGQSSIDDEKAEAFLTAATSFLNRFNGSRRGNRKNNLKRFGTKSINVIIAVAFIAVGVIFVINRLVAKHEWYDLYGFIPFGLVFLFRGLRRRIRLKRFIPMGLVSLLLIPAVWFVFYIINLIIGSGDVSVSAESISTFVRLKDNVFAIFSFGWLEILKHILFGAIGGLGLFGGISHLRYAIKR